ncbi:inositol-1-monophosphatase [Candidatus Albibeggiatoa sp. nov. BB20]|uniref:inositol-1-monophosphatase n=1 Tax=Candidatus Albibeggiatoa sp. nov. BB20 TaxID=3162723 RepID=UPI003365781C
MNPALNIAITAARRAGSQILRGLDQRHELQIDIKGQNDFVSEVDRNAEKSIIDVIQKAYPEHAIQAEESGFQEGKTEYEWIIDPLDGTTNFLHGNPQFSISIALRHKTRFEVCVVYDPLRDELFTAARGEGAQMNGRKIRVTSLPSLQNALIGTGFPFKCQQHIDVYLAMFKAMLQQVADIRRPGSAALDLAYVASGRLDGFWEIGLQPWDMAAGILLVEEAGGLVSDFGGGHDYFKTGNIITGNPRILKAILKTIRPHLTPALQR